MTLKYYSFYTSKTFLKTIVQKKKKKNEQTQENNVYFIHFICQKPITDGGMVLRVCLEEII